MLREEIFEYVKENFGSEPEYLWKKAPNYAVLRNRKNNKWYAIIMDISKEKLGAIGDEKIDIINIKCDPLLIGSLLKQQGFYKAYHMNKEHWITIDISDESISREEILDLINLSYDIVNML